MDIKAYIMRAIEIVKLNGDAAKEAAADEQGLVPGILVVAVGGLASGISSLLFHHSVSAIIVSPIVAVVFSFIGVGIVHLLASLFGGKGDYLSLYRAMSLANIVSWARIIPIIGGLAGLWMIPMTVIILERVHELERGKAIAVVAILIGAVILLFMLAVLLFGAMLAGLFGMSRMM
ncbi:MAG: YIP1 family protein [Nitrospirae bacterium]|nr:YIP1 family protein [Nitrospirota bacterium]